MHIGRNKKGWVLAPVLALALLLGACGGGDDGSGVAPESTTSLPVSQGGAVSSDISAPGSAAGSGVQPPAASSAAPAPSVVTPGEYTHVEAGRYPPERAPMLTLEEDGTAVFRLNSGNGMGVANGSYGLSGGTLTMYIEALEIGHPFGAAGTTQLAFMVLDGDNLMYTGANYGLTVGGDIFTRLGGTPYEPATPSVPPPVSGTGDASAVGSGAGSSEPPETVPSSGAQPSSAPVSSGGTSPSGDTSSGAGVSSAPVEGTLPMLEPVEAPPASMKKGEAFRLVDILPASIELDPAHLMAIPGADGTSAVFTALAEGTTTLAYSRPGGGQTAYEIKITADGPGLVLIIGIAAGAVVLGGALATVLLTLLRRRKNKSGKIDMAALGDDGMPAGGEKVKETKAVKAARKRGKKAEKAAKAAEKKAAALARQAEKAEKAAGAAAEAASAAADRVAQAEQALAGALDEAAQDGETPPAAEDGGQDAAPPPDGAAQDGGDAPTEDEAPKPPGGIFGQPLNGE